MIHEWDESRTEGLSNMEPGKGSRTEEEVSITKGTL